MEKDVNEQSRSRWQNATTAFEWAQKFDPEQASDYKREEKRDRERDKLLYKRWKAGWYYD